MTDSLIRKEDAIKALGEEPMVWTDSDFELADRNRWQMDVEALKKLPPVQPERIKGHWIEITSINHTYKCSVCGRLLVNITDGKNNVAKNYPYCHCGADMRGSSWKYLTNARSGRKNS